MAPYWFLGIPPPRHPVWDFGQTLTALCARRGNDGMLHPENGRRTQLCCLLFVKSILRECVHPWTWDEGEGCRCRYSEFRYCVAGKKGRVQSTVRGKPFSDFPILAERHRKYGISSRCRYGNSARRQLCVDWHVAGLPSYSPAPKNSRLVFIPIQQPVLSVRLYAFRMVYIFALVY